MTATAFEMPTSQRDQIQDPDLRDAVRQRAETWLQQVPASKRDDANGDLRAAINRTFVSGVVGMHSDLVDAYDRDMGAAVAKYLPKRTRETADG